MTTNPFFQLAPFIQEFIYRQRWDALRPVQVSAIQVILDTPHHVLITSGTASGKTEAAMLPILTALDTRPSTSIGVLYIGPLKALINDQFERLQAMLEETHIPVQSWHGDVAQSKKERFLAQAQGVLQITPESLEALLINRHMEVKRLLGDLRFVVIDEVHAFIGSDRGRQVLCQLQRLARYQAVPPRRIGLSATIGEPELALQWLGSGTNQEVTLINDQGARRTVSLGLEHFIVAGEDDNDLPDADSRPNADDKDIVSLPVEMLAESAIPSSSPATTQDAKAELAAALEDETVLFQHMYAMCQGVTKTLIFANQRATVEEIVTNLRSAASHAHTQDMYHVHHGSISAVLREGAEHAMRDPNKPACVAATVTLELGIDIGRLDQVLQIDATHTASSFVQRLGRSGRRNTPSQMFFYCREEAPEESTTVGELIPWNLLQTVAIIQLYLEEKWVEPPEIPKYPASLLYHQTMSILLAATELSPPQLAEQVLTLAPFQQFTLDDYRGFLRHLIAIQHLEVTETGTLIIGLAAENIVNHYHFYATFAGQIDYRVLEGAREIGTIHTAPEVDGAFRLAGYTWRVLNVDADSKVIFVERARGKATTHWIGDGGAVHTRILQRMRQVLQEESEYEYLQKRARQRLHQARQLARATGIATLPIVDNGGGAYLLLPWQGTRCMVTLAAMLQHAGVEQRNSKLPYYLAVNGVESQASLQAQLVKCLSSPPKPEELVGLIPEADLQRAKFDRYVPVALLQQAYQTDELNCEDALEALQRITRQEGMRSST